MPCKMTLVSSLWLSALAILATEMPVNGDIPSVTTFLSSNIDGASTPLTNGEASTGTIDYYGRKLNVLSMFLQSNYKEGSPGRIGPRGLYHAAGVVVDRSSTPNHVYIVDSGNSRVIGLQSLASDKADIVIGQPDLYSGAANGDCNLGAFGPTRADQLCLMGYPFGTNTAEQWMFANPDVDGEGNLYMPDIYNNRILMYRSPFSLDKTGGKGDSIADFVLGQPDFVSNGINRGNGSNVRDAKSLFISFGGFDHVASRGVSVDSLGNVWVADTFNYRVLRFPKGSAVADLVLGAPDFVNSQPIPEYSNRIPEAPLNRMCTPTMARINPETGDLYVVDEFPGGFPARILVFKPPFTNGMSASRAVFPKQQLIGDFVNGYRLSHATGLLFNPVKTDDWIDPVTKTHKYRDGVFWLHDGGNSRTLLLDADGNILLAVGAPDTYTYGRRDVYYPPKSVTPSQTFNLVWPGGALGFDTNNNIYLADGGKNQVARFAMPYRTQTIDGRVYLPYSNGGVFYGSNDKENESDTVHCTSGSRLGAVSWHNQLLFRDTFRYMVWNNYLTKPIGAPADFVVEYPSSHIMGRATHGVDDMGRMWTTGEHGKLMVFQLPLRSDSRALRDLIPLYWADEQNTEVQYNCGQVVSYDAKLKHIWFFDNANHRLLRVRNPDNWSGKLLVDVVIGQSDKTTSAVNRGMSHPDASSLGEVNSVQFDHLGNMFVADNTYELNNNGRVIAFSAKDLAAINKTIPDIKAQWVYIANKFDQHVSQRKFWPGQNANSPVCVAINSRNELVIGNDGYYTDSQTRSVNQLYLYRNPLTKPTPDAVIELPLGAPGEVSFDENDNLVVQDHTWNRLWVINLDRDPSWLRELAQPKSLYGQIRLGGFIGNVASRRFTAAVNSVSDPDITQLSSLLPQSNGNFTLSNYLLPPYDVRISGSHFLTVKATNVYPELSLNVNLTNGDANGDNQVNLFDLVVLDSKFSSSDALADLDGDGKVNLFDYTIIDSFFGAKGD